MEKTVRVTINGVSKEYPFTRICPVSDYLQETGFSMPCAGRHTCGKCKVKAYGALSPLSAEERRLLTMEEQLSNVRLACCAEVEGSCSIAVQSEKAAVKTGGASFTKSGSNPSPFGSDGYALAADIGTTTIAAYLVDLSDRDAAPVLAASALNAQASFGADVVSRIESCMKQGVRPLQELVLKQLDDLFTALCTQKKIKKQSVHGAVVTGNTTMLHLFSGLDPSGIAVAPYTPQSLFGVMYSARGLLSVLPPAAPVYLPPCVSGYVGADTVCAMTACGFSGGDLLVDIGTNGEMALATPEGILCCSTAAGPAFEGAGLSCGQFASAGAIDAVYPGKNGFSFHVIGGGEATGLCGSGAISALAALLEAGMVDETGLLDERYGGRFWFGESGVFLSQEDIRQLQLAKAAIAAGIDALLHSAGIEPAQVRRLLIAGGFGSSLQPGDAVRIGLIPATLADRMSFAGNAAGMGACLCASSQSEIDEAEKIAAQSVAIDLGGDDYFNEQFIERMLF